MLKFLFIVLGVASMCFAVDESKILDFWFERENAQAQWFASDQAFDETIKEQFGTMLASYDGTQELLIPEDPEKQLALVILFDQFSRNIHRNSSNAYRYDQLALQIVQKGVQTGADKKLKPIQRAFYYMPFEHSEDLAVQNQSIELFQALHKENPTDALLKGFYTYAVGHHAIIKQFGRYPHRNAVLNRPSTDKEIAFLEKPGSSF